MAYRILLALALLLSACSGTPDNVKVVSGFEADKYLGTWYEIARLDHSFERGLDKVTATYSKREDGGIKVINRGFDTEKQSWKEAEGKAYFVESPNIGKLKVSFFGPFYGGYNIVELDRPYYNYAMVAGPDKSYLWILARTPQLPYPIKAQLLAKAKDMGFDTDALIYVQQ
jgi:apolipoprotein D and lipocalin family protein